MVKSRPESFSVRVFAFAITLLALGIPIPDLKTVDNPHMRIGLLHSMQQLVPYITSFATIGIIFVFCLRKKSRKPWSGVHHQGW